jgi:SH3 domain protein
MRAFIALVALLALPAISAAETRFVEIEATLRTGQGTEFSIVRMIRSGSAVEVLQEDRQKGYTKIRVPGGGEGWILSRYLTDSPIGAEQLVAATQRVDQLTRENKELTVERDRYMKEADTLAENLERLKALSSNALSLEETNKQLRSTTIRDQETIERLQAENAVLASSSTRDWFIAGGGVLAFGILLGVVVPRIRWRRRRSWSDL